MRMHVTPTRSRPRLRTALGGVGIAVACALAAAPAATAAPAAGFTDEQKSAVYESDGTAGTGSQSAPDPTNWSIAMMDVFSDLRTDLGDEGVPHVSSYNDALTSVINLGATDAERDRAIVDQYGDMGLTMADGLGEQLGAIYTAAWEAGELPKTRWLVSKSGGKLGSTSSTNPPKNFFDFDRPYLRLDPTTELRYVDREGGDAWGSTSGAFPSGHTSQAYWQGTALAVMLPELAPQILARTSEAGHNRIVMGAHYPLDVISGRMMGQKIVQLRLADAEMVALVDEAAQELRGVLEAGCGDDLVTCIATDTPYLPTDEALDVYEERLAYDFPLTGTTDAAVVVPDGIESLLVTSHPELTDAQRREVFALTATSSGHPLDAGEEESWQRMNLAAAMSASVTVNEDGSVSIGEPTSPEPEPTPEPEPSPEPEPEPTASPEPEPSASPEPTSAPEPTTAPSPAETTAPLPGDDDTSEEGALDEAAAAGDASDLADTGGDATFAWTIAAMAAALLGAGILLTILRRRAEA